MTRTVQLVCAYDGTDFHGWQAQEGMRTVQGVLEAALRRVVRHEVALIGSGRTDAGVHAAGHVSNFKTDCALESNKLRYAMGARLPTDVSIITLRDVQPRFHATHDATSKLYRYRIHNARARPVQRFTQRYVYHCWNRLELETMQRAAIHFVGKKDFRAMVPERAIRSSTVRTIFRFEVERHLNEIRIDVEGDGFLYNQVRTMVGTLINVGRGLWPPEHVGDVLEGGDRNKAGPRAPALGLCLQWVRYPCELLRPPIFDTTPGELGTPGGQDEGTPD